MTLDDIRKKIVGGIHDATGTYNKIARAVPLVPTTQTVAKIVSNAGKSINSEIKALPTYTNNLSKASNSAKKSVISQVDNVRKKIISEAKALPTYTSNVSRAISNPATAKPNFDLIRSNAPKNVIGKFAVNNVANAGESFVSGAHDVVEASKIYAKNRNNPVAYVKGAMGIAKIVSPTTPFFQGAQVAQSTGQTFKIKPVEKFSTGLLRGQTGVEINPGMKEDKINTPVGSFDPVVGVGSMLGFTKNPAWSKIFGATTPINSAVITKNPVLNYFATRGTKGSIEGSIQGAAEWDDNKPISENLKSLGSNIAFGTLSEVAMDKPFEMATKKTSEITKKAWKFLESISMTSSQKHFASQGMVGNVRSIHPEDLGIFDQANTILNEQKRYSPKQVQEAKNYMYLFAEKYLPNRLQPEGADAKLIARRLQKRMGDGTLQSFEGGFMKLDEPVGAANKKPEIRPGETIGEFQRRLESTTRPLLTVLNDALSKRDIDTAQNTLDLMRRDPTTYSRYINTLQNTVDMIAGQRFQQGGYAKLDADIIGTPRKPANSTTTLSKGQLEYVKHNPNVQNAEGNGQFIPKTIEQLSKEFSTADDFVAAMKSKDFGHPREILDEFYSKYKIQNQDQVEEVIRRIWNKENLNSTKQVGIKPQDSTKRMFEMMSYGRIMQRAGYKAPQIKGTSLQTFKERILPTLPGQLRAEFLNNVANVPKLLETDQKQAIGAAKALLEMGRITQDDFDSLIRLYVSKGSLNPGAKTPMKQVMRDKYMLENQDALDSLVNMKSNEELRTQLNKPNTQQTQLARPAAEIKRPSLDQADDEVGKIFGDASNEPPTSGKTGPLREQVDRIKRELENKFVEPSVPVYDTAIKDRIANNAQQRAIEDKNEFLSMFAKWVGMRDAAKTKATKTAEVLAKIPKESAWDVVRYIENPDLGVNESVKKYAAEVVDMYENLYKQAQNDGIDMNKLVGYVTHIWKESPAMVQQKMLGLGQKFKFAKERGIPTYEEGIAMGLTPKYSNPAEIMQEYVRRLETVRANRGFFEQLKKMGIVVDASIGGDHSAFQPITGQGFPQSISSTNGHVVTGNYYAPREVAEIINRVFNPQEANKVLKSTAWASGKMQDILMSGGIPKSPVNAWSLAQLTKELHAGRVTRPVAAFIRSFSGEASNKFFSDNAGQIMKMQERNIPISSTYNVSNMVDKPVLKKVFGDNWSDVWSKVTNEPTFKRFMPQLQVSLFNDIEKGAIKAGKSQREAADIAAQAVKNFYAVRLTDSAALSNPNIEALKTTFLFAPSYRETMIKFWLNNVKAVLPAYIKRDIGGLKIELNNPLSTQNINNTRFVIGSLLALATMNRINEQLNDGKGMLENPRGREDQLLIPLSKITGDTKDTTVIGFPWLSSIAYMPRTLFKIAKTAAAGDLKQIPKEAKGFLSTALRPVADVMTNEDYFQNEIYGESDAPVEKWKKTGDYLFKQYGLQHPYAKTGYEAMQGKIKSPFELVSKATELPLRFTTKDKIKSQYYYQNRDEVLNKLTDEERKAFISLPKKSESETESQTAAETRIKYNTYVRYPAVLEAQREIAIRSANGDMNKVDPLYALDTEQIRYFAAYTAASPGSYERRNILKEAPWIKDFQAIRSEFFDKTNRERIAEDLTSGKITQAEADEKIKALNESKLAYSSSSGTGSGKKKFTIKKVAAIKRGKNTSQTRTIKLKRVSRNMAPKSSNLARRPRIRIKKARSQADIAKKFRVVIGKKIS